MKINKGFSDGLLLCLCYANLFLVIYTVYTHICSGKSKNKNNSFVVVFVGGFYVHLHSPHHWINKGLF